jgi:hypothetical protein
MVLPWLFHQPHTLEISQVCRGTHSPHPEQAHGTAAPIFSSYTHCVWVTFPPVWFPQLHREIPEVQRFGFLPTWQLKNGI